MRICCFSVSALLFFSPVSTSQEASIFDLSIEELMNIKVYSANKSFNSINNLSSNITVITRQDIEQMGFSNLENLIAHIPGLYTIDTYRDVLIGTRGSINGSVAFLINGVLTHPASTPGVRSDLRGRMNIPIESIDRIEYVRSPQAVIYGDSAFYGSINIITNLEENPSQISYAQGNNKQEKIFARYLHSYADGHLVVNLGSWKTDGIGGDLENTIPPAQLASYFPGYKTELDGLLAHENLHADVYAKHKNTYLYAKHSDMAYGFYANTPSFEDGNLREVKDSQFNIGHQKHSHVLGHYKIDYIYTRQTLDIDHFDFNVPFLDGSQNQEYEAHALDIHSRFEINTNVNLLIGSWFQTINAQQHSTVTVMGNLTTDGHTKASGYADYNLYSQLHYQINDWISLSAGLRYSQTRSHTIEVTDPIIPEDNETTHKSNSDKWLPQLGSVFHINEQHRIKFQYGKANQKDNNPLARDTDELIESISLQHSFNTQKSSLDSTIYHNIIENLNRTSLRLVPDPDNPGETMSELRTDDSGKLKGTGLELIFKHQLSNYLTYGTSITFQETTDTNNPNIAPGYSPEMLAKFNITYLIDHFTLNLNGNYVDEMLADWQFDNNANVERIGGTVDGYVNINTNIRYSFSDTGFVNLNISNVADEDIRYPATEFVDFYGGGFGYGRLYLLSVGTKF